MRRIQKTIQKRKRSLGYFGKRTSFGKSLVEEKEKRKSCPKIEIKKIFSTKKGKCFSWIFSHKTKR